MKLICKKYVFPNGTPQEDKNFFSTVTPTLEATIDLSLYYERFSMSDVEYGFENTSGGTENTLFVEASNFTFRCRKEVTGQTINLQDFFEFFSYTNLSKWTLEFYDETNQLIYTGLLYKNNIKFPRTKNKLINILCVGYEREFKEYYNNVPLGSSAAFGYSFGSSSNPITGLRNFKLYPLQTFIPNVFTNVSFQLDSWMNKWYVSELPYTFSPSDKFYGTNHMHIKTGYDAFLHDKVSKFNFINGMFQTMGWVWFFYLGKMYVKKRGDITLALHTINHRLKSITDGIENVITEKQSDVIVIDSGSYFDNGNSGTSVLSGISIFRDISGKSFNLGGDRSMFYSEKFPYYNIERPFRSIDYDADQNEYRHSYFNWTFSGGHDINEREIIYNKLAIGTTSPYSVDINPTNYPISKITQITPVINSRDNSGGYDKQNPRAGNGVDPGAYYGNGNFYYAANQVNTQEHVYYNGHPGHCLIKYEPSINKYLNYEAYCNIQEFRDNFNPLLRSEVQLVFNYEVHELQTNPFICVNIEEYPHSNIADKKFTVQKLAFNYEAGITKYILQNA